MALDGAVHASNPPPRAVTVPTAAWAGAAATPYTPPSRASDATEAATRRRRRAASSLLPGPAEIRIVSPTSLVKARRTPSCGPRAPSCHPADRNEAAAGVSRNSGVPVGPAAAAAGHRSNFAPSGSTVAPNTVAMMDVEGASDAALVVAIARWNEAALAEAYRRHGGAVQSLGRRLLRSDTHAEDITQEVFVKLWEQPERI